MYNVLKKEEPEFYNKNTKLLAEVRKYRNKTTHHPETLLTPGSEEFRSLLNKMKQSYQPHYTNLRQFTSEFEILLGTQAIISLRDCWERTQ